jgi:phospholipase C
MSVAPTADGLDGADSPPEQFGDIRDVQHVVILMQENRSFDHYVGSLRGVIGFGDRAAITLPGGLSVWQQPSTPPGLPVTSTQLPWRLTDAPPSAYPALHQPSTSAVGAQGYGGTSHEWDDQHAAWSGGWMNGWQFAKGGPTTLGYLDRRDIPFQYALADAYTVGDAYFCSAMSATGPNRTYLWSGTINADQRHGSFMACSGGDELGRFLPWESYAETLQEAGVTWKIYQGSDNFGDNGAEYFAAFARYDPRQGGTRGPGNALMTTEWRWCRNRARLLSPTPTTWPGRSEPTSWPARCRRSPGSSPTRPSPSTPTAHRPTAPTTCIKCSRR